MLISLVPQATFDKVRDLLLRSGEPTRVHGCPLQGLVSICSAGRNDDNRKHWKVYVVHVKGMII